MEITLNQTENTALQYKPSYSCPVCKDEGLIETGGGSVKYCECIEQKRNIRRINESGLAKQLEKCSFDSFVAIDDWQETLKERALSFLNQTEHWFFIGGQVGSGKTHLCTAIAGELLKSRSLKYMLWRDEAVRLKACVNDDEEYFRLITPLKNCKALYIDDFFKVSVGGKPTPGDINIAFEIINFRYNNPDLITIISSEFSINEIISFDEAIGGRIHQRAGDFCLNIDRNSDKDYRLRQNSCSFVIGVDFNA